MVLEGALLISLSFLVAFVLDEYVDSRFRAQSSTISLVKTLVSLYVVVVVLYMTLPVFQDRVSENTEEVSSQKCERQPLVCHKNEV